MNLTADLPDEQQYDYQDGYAYDMEYQESEDGRNLDSDHDDELDHGHSPFTSSEKRKAQNDIFRAYAAKRAEQLTEKEVQEALSRAKDDRLSIKDILEKQVTSTQITKSREYQTELYERAKDKNIIAVLDTGSGKTHIATLLLRHVLDKELESRTRGEAPKTAFFLVDSVNLVFQQANVLKCGLDHNVEGICGAMGASLWQKSTWNKLFANNMVIICTAEVLVQCIMHSFITMSRVNLLIFDEAHHAKNNHPYARLIKEYYLNEPDSWKRPQIFGMTASPVDANMDVRQAARDLETLLHCQICTTSDLSLLQNNISRPTEEVVVYSRLKAPFETSLHQELRGCYGDVPVFQNFFRTSKGLASELGPWASDMFWSFAFSEEESRKIEMRQERKFNVTKSNHSIEVLDKQITQLKEAAKYVQNHEFGLPTPTSEHLSSKVLELHRWLQLYYSRTGEARCIVFVERRSTARLLNLIFTQIGGPNLRTDILVGVNSNIGDLNVSLRNQVMTVAKFRRGELNCLFSTSVAEEGLDIPQCNLVVRFDLYHTMIGYVQSRGRARHRNSKYVHMVEQDNLEHKAVVWEARSAERIMKDFCNRLPNDRLIDGSGNDVDRLLVDERNYRSYTDPESGAKLTYRSSLSVLAHFVGSLPAANTEMSYQPTYIVSHNGGMFICEVVLPEHSPISSARGRPYKKKAIAKCSAAFELCLQLRAKGLLDSTLLPTITRQLPAMRNALLAISAKKKDQYLMRVKPKFWQLAYGVMPECLYLTVVDVSVGLDRPHQPLGLLTKACPPLMPKFPIYLEDGRPSYVMSMPLLNALPVTREKLKLLTKLTLQIYFDIFAKKFEDDDEKMSYWVVPIRADIAKASKAMDGNPDDLIDWEQVHEVCGKGDYPWTPEMPNDFLRDKYFVDKWDGGRRFYSLGVVPDLRPQDPVPENVPRHKFMANILDYSVSLWSKTRTEKVWVQNQPVVEVEKIPFRRNLLAVVEMDEPEVKIKPKTVVCPEPMKISALTTCFVAMCYVLPAIIHRFDSYLIALDACSLLGLDIGPALALEALTKDSENSDEHGEEKINFRSGMGPNYERLEFMGDCFLKMATSIAVFVQQPNENEFEFHVRRMVMLCNKNLFETAHKYKLYEYVRTMAFSRRTWYPEGIKMIWGKGHKQDGPKIIKHSLADKSVADVCEAFIGAAFMEHNDPDNFSSENWDQAVKAVTVLVDSEDHTMQRWSDYYAAYEMPHYQIAEATASQLDLAEKVEQKHPYHFRYPRILRSAFIHSSQAFMWENIPNYERLEFLGDSLLDMAFIMHIFYRYPDKDPQWLTEHKMPMVSNEFLAAICVKLGFHHYLRQNNAILSAQIRDYVAEITAAEADSDGAVDYWTTVSKAPKCLADVVEAYVGAMFVDSEFDFGVVQSFFDHHMKHFFMDMSLYDDFANNHPVTRLRRLIDLNFGCKEFRIACMPMIESAIPGARSTVICMVLIHNEVRFDGTSVSDRYARLKAANIALDKLEGLLEHEYKQRYGCNCVDENEESDSEVEDSEETEASEERMAVLRARLARINLAFTRDYESENGEADGTSE
ncbi:dicer-like protein-like protein 1 [Lojkania enalia]|uniref:Dicer-like protein 1 n=1 Tax=Lojkania enalia TaxID=147567 RepID=A0A9P4MV25_9PLEO|nr:dicer-like protein-like protein 1 [Didymosphaeria enalia]